MMLRLKEGYVLPKATTGSCPVHDTRALVWPVRDEWSGTGRPANRVLPFFGEMRKRRWKASLGARVLMPPK
jgi:hypothetical protein